MTLSAVREALRIALKNGAVSFAEHAFDGVEDEGVNERDVIAELRVAHATRDISRNRSHAGLWVAFGVYLAISFKVVEPSVVVITVFEARQR